MKRIILLLILLASLVSRNGFAQKADCKFVSMKTAQGKILQMVKVPAKLGNLTVCKDDGKLVINYETKGIFDFIKPENAAQLRIDTIKFVLAGDRLVNVKATWGVGIVANGNHDLQPHMTNAHFVVALDMKSTEANLLLTNPVTGFLILGERNSKLGDLLNDKQQANLTQAFACIQ